MAELQTEPDASIITYQATCPACPFVTPIYSLAEEAAGSLSAHYATQHAPPLVASTPKR